MLVSLGALIPFPGTLLELVLSLCLQRGGVRGLLLSPASPCVAQAAPGVTGKEPAASSPHGPAGKVRSTTGAKSCSPSHSLHTAPSWDSLVHRSCGHALGTFATAEACCSPFWWSPLLGAKARGCSPLAQVPDPAGRGSGACLGLCEEMRRGWLGRVGSQVRKSPFSLVPFYCLLLPKQHVWMMERIQTWHLSSSGPCLLPTHFQHIITTAACLDTLC